MRAGGRSLDQLLISRRPLKLQCLVFLEIGDEVSDEVMVTLEVECGKTQRQRGELRRANGVRLPLSYSPKSTSILAEDAEGPDSSRGYPEYHNMFTYMNILTFVYRSLLSILYFAIRLPTVLVRTCDLRTPETR